MYTHYSPALLSFWLPLNDYCDDAFQRLFFQALVVVVRVHGGVTCIEWIFGLDLRSAPLLMPHTPTGCRGIGTV